MGRKALSLSSHCCAFQLQQPFLFLNASRIAGQAAVRTDDPVTGNNDRNGIMAYRAAHGLGGHPWKAPFFCHLFCQFSIGNYLAVRNFTEKLPDLFLKFRSGR